jgi:tetratricopeptide (TPR) repeat protein
VSARAFRIALACPLLALAGGCLDARPELVARHAAERARWEIDHTERDWSPAQVRAAHAEIARRFADGEAPPEGTQAREDYRVRVAIAGSSALYAADLRAGMEGASWELAAEYGAVAERWPHEPELLFLGRLREAATLQRLGARHEALAEFRLLLAAPADSAATPETRDLRCDLEVHTALLAVAVAERSDVTRVLADAGRRLAAEIERRGAGTASRRPRRRAAEIAFLAGDTRGARATFEALAGDAATPDERAELQLAIGEMEQYAEGDTDAAEHWYRRAAEEGALLAAAAEARVRLVELSAVQGRPKVGVRSADEVLALGARALGDRASEAQYWKARCLLDMGRWTEALPSLIEGSQGDPASPFTLACAASWYRRVENLQEAGRLEATARLLAVAAAVPEPKPVDVPMDWARAWRAERSRFAWEEGLEALREVARGSGDPAEAATAEKAAGKILRERTIFAQRTPDDTPDGRR